MVLDIDDCYYAILLIEMTNGFDWMYKCADGQVKSCSYDGGVYFKWSIIGSKNGIVVIFW
jgi:hypothetical protein